MLESDLERRWSGNRMAERQMTILQILPALQGGGVERGVLEVAEALVANGFRSLVISQGGRLVKELEAAGSEHFVMPIGAKSWRALPCIAKLRSFILQQQVDLIDYHSRLPGWVTLAAWKSLVANKRPRLVSSLHGLHSVNYYSSVMCRGEWIVVVSETVRQYVRQHFPFVPEERLIVIHRGVDAAEFPRGFTPSHSWRETFFSQFPQLRNVNWITLVGRITRLKGHEDMLQAIQAMRAAGENVHGVIVGGVDPKKERYREYLADRVSELGLERHVTFVGERRDLKEIYSMSRAVVSLSSTPESFGRSVAEALAVGTPVIGYDHGGVSEILAAQFPEGRVPTGDIQTLVNRLCDVIHNDRRGDVGPTVFTRAKMLEQTIATYRRIMGLPVDY